MSERNIGQEILEGIQDIKAYKADEKALRTHTFTQPSIIPLAVQLEAICTLNVRRVCDLMASYVPELREWNAKSAYRESYQVYLRRYFTFTPDDLIDYLKGHLSTCRSLLQASDDKRSTPSTFLEEWENNQYRVGWVNSWASRNEKPLETQIRVFQSFPEAAADYVLFSWGFPRLTKEQATWYEMDHF